MNNASMVLSEEDIKRLIETSTSRVELEYVISTAGLADQIIRRASQVSDSMPWSKVSGHFDRRYGELTIWAGDNGSGKSLLVGQTIAWLLGQGKHCLIASMEMSPADTVHRLCCQTAGCEPSDDWVRRFCDWADKKLWIYDRLETVQSDHVLAMIRAVAMELGVEHVVIDSLVKCGVAQDGNGYLTAQTQFVDSLQHLAKHLNIHIHLICHTRKPENSKTRISKHDVRGASQITDLADNVLLISRNKSKEAARRKAADGHPLTNEEEKALEYSDCYLEVAKQRHHAYEGVFAFDFHDPSKQWVPAGLGHAMHWGDLPA
jgi:twinkle protein